MSNGIYVHTLIYVAQCIAQCYRATRSANSTKKESSHTWFHLTTFAYILYCLIDIVERDLDIMDCFLSY